MIDLVLAGVVVGLTLAARRSSRPAGRPAVKVVRVASKRWSARRAAARRIRPTRIEPVRSEPAPRETRSTARKPRKTGKRTPSVPDWTLPPGVQGERFNTPVVLDHQRAKRLVPGVKPGQRVEVHGRAVDQSGVRYMIVCVCDRRGERRMRSVSEFGDTAVAGWRW